MEGKELIDNDYCYKLIKVTDYEGNDRSKSSYLYMNRINCTAINFTLSQESNRLKMVFVQNEDGKYINRYLNTSRVNKIERSDQGITVYTKNSILVFEKTVLKEPVYLNEPNICEMYLSNDEHFKYSKGFYYDEESTPFECEVDVNVGTFTDSVLIHAFNTFGLYRYYTEIEGVTFYNYANKKRLLIHNMGSSDLIVNLNGEYRIKPNESMYIDVDK